MGRPLSGAEKRKNINLTLEPDIIALAREMARSERSSLSQLFTRFVLQKGESGISMTQHVNGKHNTGIQELNTAPPVPSPKKKPAVKRTK